MNGRRTLALKRETLTELTPGELNAVVGGSHTCICPITHGPSLDEPCPTTPVFDCLTPRCAL